jgi:ribonuclease HI
MAKPLYEASRGPIQEPLDPSQPVSGHFKTLLQALLQTPALCLPDLIRPFFLYISERQGFALGVLEHHMRPCFAPEAYLSKQLDPTTRGWALRHRAAASLLIHKSKKLTFGSPLTVYSLHSLSELLIYKGLYSMPPSCIVSLHVSLVEDPTLTFVLCPPLNPANLLPHSSTSLVHCCPEILEDLLSCPDHIQEGTLSQADYTWFIDGSSFIHNGQQRAGYAIVSDSSIIEECPLPLGTTSQKAELTALARALTLEKVKTVNIYTDSKYAFHTLLSHSAIWKERGFLTARETPIINAALTVQVLEASHLPSQVGICHCKAHQTDSSLITRGNN